ncbi:MAG TPA: carboxymuconolactone decarboxylase family protein [Gammaproteobacteria bacterium]|nr:carboxymuconolactone decarboxylase family protein [Gammaproteobacteria bacterium]
MRSRLVVTWLCSLGLAGLAAAQTAAPAGDLDPKLVGTRFAPLQWSQMSEAQKTMMRHVLDGPRTAANGPFNVMARSPVMGDLAQELGAQVRFNSTLPPALREMAILMAARHWTGQYEWQAHKALALEAGLDPKVVAAIATGAEPASMQAKEAALHRFCSELLATKHVGNDTFAAAKAAFGEQGMTEIMYTLGYYSMVSMMLNVDEYPLPAGQTPELKPLAN